MGKPDYTQIFIVEDDKFYAGVIRHALESRNFMNVKVLTSGEDCINNMHLNPEIILMDYMLGENHLDGMETMKQIRKMGNAVQIIFLTSVDELEVATNTIKAGAYDYVVKSEAAIERIRNLIRRITFENHIKKENMVLKRSRKVVLSIIFLLSLGIIILALIQILG